jgi:hypothetical protein
MPQEVSFSLTAELYRLPTRLEVGRRSDDDDSARELDPLRIGGEHHVGIQHVTTRENEGVGKPQSMLRAELGSATADLAVDREDPDREAVEKPVHGCNVGRSTPRRVDDRLGVGTRGYDDIARGVISESLCRSCVKRVGGIE